MSSRYYAIAWTYGRATDANTGKRIGQYRSFPSRRAREDWVSAGPYYTTDRGYREAIPAADPELRTLLAADARDEVSSLRHGARVIRREEELEDLTDLAAI